MVDDLRLAFQRSQVTLPQGTDDLYYFADIHEPKKRHVWQNSPEQLRDALIAVGEIMAPAIEAVVLNHLNQRHPIIIEGDGILPSLLDRPLLRERWMYDTLQMLYIVEPDESALLSNILTRGRGTDDTTFHDLRAEARAKHLFSEWIVSEAKRYDVPVVTSRPWNTLIERVFEVANASNDAPE